MFERIGELEAGKELDFAQMILKRHVSEDHPQFGNESKKMVKALEGARAKGLNIEEGQKELEFSMMVGPGLFTGKMDLLVEEEDIVHVIDYKTNVITKDRTMDTLMEEYGPQLDLYALAAGKIFDRKVKTSIYFTDSRELISKEVQDKNDLKGIEEQVSKELNDLLNGKGKDGDCKHCPVAGLCKKVKWGEMGGN